MEEARNYFDATEAYEAEFEKLFIHYLRGKHQADVLDVLRTGKIDDDVMSKLKAAAQEIAGKYVTTA